MVRRFWVSGFWLWALLLSCSHSAFERSAAVWRQQGDFTMAAPETQGVKRAALMALRQRAEVTHSDAVVILKEGKVIADWAFGTPRTAIDSMSITKLVAGLSAGFLLGEGKLSSLDTPIVAIFPEYQGGLKASVTVRHLLTHTSGIQAARTMEALYEAPDSLQYALDTPVVEVPGTAFMYNHTATQLLSGLTERLAGEPLHRYLASRLLEAVGARDWHWRLDPAGHAYAMSDLALRPIDLARIGDVIRAGGKSTEGAGKQLLSPAFVRESMQPDLASNKMCGLSWFLFYQGKALAIDDAIFAIWKQNSVRPSFIQHLAPLRNRRFDNPQALLSEVERLGEVDTFIRLRNMGLKVVSIVNPGQLQALYAEGWLGQYLVIYPRKGLVAVRMIREYGNRHERTRDFNDFIEYVGALVN